MVLKKVHEVLGHRSDITKDIPTKDVLEYYGCPGLADNAGDLVYNAEKPLTDFHKVPTYQNVHTARRMKMLAKYPQIKELYTPDPWVAVVTGSIVASQMLMCYCMSDKQVWFILLCSYLFGSFANQALFLCIHDLSHNTAFGHRWKLPNNFMSMIANTPAVVPMSVSFRKYHLDHHTSMNVEVEDVDVPTDLEGRLIGGNWFLKLTWTTLQIVWYAIRPVLTNPKPLTWDDVVNWLYILAVDYGVLAGWGWRSFLYLVFCSFVGGGLHPMAGHFIAEHYVFAKGQETYSYYGILNFFGMNAGYHVEHHDFPRIPGTKLPFVHQIAPEFYQDLYCHTSWVWVLYTYLTSPAMGPFSRHKQKPLERGQYIRPNGYNIDADPAAETRAKMAEEASKESESGSGSESLAWWKTTTTKKKVVVGTTTPLARGSSDETGSEAGSLGYEEGVVSTTTTTPGVTPGVTGKDEGLRHRGSAATVLAMS